MLTWSKLTTEAWKLHLNSSIDILYISYFLVPLLENKCSCFRKWWFLLHLEGNNTFNSIFCWYHFLIKSPGVFCLIISFHDSWLLICCFSSYFTRYSLWALFRDSDHTIIMAINLYRILEKKIWGSNFYQPTKWNSCS